MRGVATISDLPLGEALGRDFESAENRSWLNIWAERLMGIAPEAGYGWFHGPELVGGSLLWEAPSGDWLEIDVEIRRRPELYTPDADGPQPVWSVSAALMVGCWCDDDHNAHHIFELAWDVGSPEALSERCNEIYSLAKSWVSDTTDADEWLRRAGLPRRSESTTS